MCDQSAFLQNVLATLISAISVTRNENPRFFINALFIDGSSDMRYVIQ